MRTVVDQIAAHCTVEASGGITLANVAEVAQSGVDIISIGALTHSPRALDISLDYETKNA
jgi:nicotinate-nucleotide pyrophosphorylase (carboxylating)